MKIFAFATATCLTATLLAAPAFAASDNGATTAPSSGHQMQERGSAEGAPGASKMKSHMTSGNGRSSATGGPVGGKADKN